MGENLGIANHQAQQDDPPDILLTNCKMLDYLLLQPQDQRLWRFNTAGVCSIWCWTNCTPTTVPRSDGFLFDPATQGTAGDPAW
ncbi:MAG UNVERIFIED_CONTAM: hypothetical protein LVT10_03040 [Anaerolineae bacterium]|jgi:hypothetical protein